MRKINKYRLFTELQHGPVTRVYKAIQPELQRVVLVKQLNPVLVTDDELVERFKQEGLILAKINSSHVITIFDFGFEDGIPFLVTEFVEGNTLAKLIQQNVLFPWDISLHILQQLTQGLIAIHNRNIIHQDIKPENIFISNEGEVKLGDLGFSSPLEKVDLQIQGTPAYLPPEVVLGSPIDFRSDLYSLGLVGYEMLTGENPFAAKEMPMVLNRIVNLKPITVHVVRPEVPVQFSGIITKLMMQAPDERYQSAKDVYQELDHFKNLNGIKVDTSSLVNFLQEPEKYKITRIKVEEKIAQPIQKPKKKRKAVLTFGLIIFSILIVLMVKFLGNVFSFLSGNADTTRSTIEQNFNQHENQNNKPLITTNSEKNIKPEITKPASSSENLIDEGVPKDTLKIPIVTETKKDSVIISSDPRAVIFQYGDSLGITPFTLILQSKKEPLQIEFRSPGFPVIKKTITFFEPTVQKFHIDLWKEVGYLDISIIPWGEIWIDGDSIDVSPMNRLIILAPGNHKLAVRHPLLKNVMEHFFFVVVGETLKKEIHLQRK